MLQLGRMYHGGFGVSKNHLTAYSLFHAAASAGEPRAMAMVGMLFRDGLGVSRSEWEAASWLRKAVAAGLELPRDLREWLDGR